MAAPPPSRLDGNQCLQHAFDDAQGCFRVCVIDGTSGPGGGIEVVIDHTEDSIRLGDGSSFLTSTADSGKNALDVNVILPVGIKDSGGDELAINADGSLNVSLSGGKVATATYNEVTSVASSSVTNITSFVPGSTVTLTKVMASGTNIAYYEVLVNGTVRAKKYTYFGGNLSIDFDFGSGVSVSSGQTILVRVEHIRPSTGDFNATIITEA